MIKDNLACGLLTYVSLMFQASQESTFLTESQVCCWSCQSEELIENEYLRFKKILYLFLVFGHEWFLRSCHCYGLLAWLMASIFGVCGAEDPPGFVLLVLAWVGLAFFLS